MNRHVLKEAILNLLYPRTLHCKLCGADRPPLPWGLCVSCRNSLPFIHPPVCSFCGRPQTEAADRCPDCIHLRHAYDQVRSVFEYTASLRDMVYRYKYDYEYHYAAAFGPYMAEAAATWSVDAMLPVPLHPRRLQLRGYNQSELLAEAVCDRRSLPLLTGVLVRVMDTPAQARLGRAQRIKNLDAAFAVKRQEAVCGKRLILVDDVYTTGSTADCCSRALRAAGADKIYVLTLASVRNTP